jgi:hypothetical protein
LRLKIILIVVSIIALILALGTEIRMAIFKKNTEKQINRLSAELNDKVNSLGKELEKMNTYFQPNGLVEKYIVSNKFLKNQLDDLDSILTYFQGSSNSGYIQLYITGHEDVWVSFRDSNSYIFQGNISPGLNENKFFFFKEPEIETKYTHKVPYNSSFKAGDPSRVYFLIKETGQSRLLKHPDITIDNISEDLNLYIPTITGN